MRFHRACAGFAGSCVGPIRSALCIYIPYHKKGRMPECGGAPFCGEVATILRRGRSGPGSSTVPTGVSVVPFAGGVPATAGD